MLYSFTGAMGLLLGIKLVAAILFFIFRSHAKEIIEDAMRDGISKYGIPSYPFYTTGWDKIHTIYSCCGMDSYRDWENSAFSENSGNLAPSSCCVTAGCNVTYESINRSGCFGNFKADLRNKLYIVGTIAAVVAFLQLFTTIAACYFGEKARRSHQWNSMLSLKRYHPC